VSSCSTDFGYKRFLAIALLAFASLFFVVWIWVLEAPLAYEEYDYSIWLAKMTLVRDGRVGSLCIMGDSNPCAALLPERIGPGAVNLGLPTGTPIEICNVARKVIASRPLPEAVVISILPSNFVSSDHFWDVAVQYGFFSLSDLEEVRSKSRALRDSSVIGPESPGDADVRVKSLLYAIKFPSFYFPALIHAHVYGRYRFNEERLKLVLADRGHSYFGTDNGSSELDKEAALKSFVPSKLLDDYFNQTLALFHSQNIPVYFVAMPHNEASVQHYYPGLKEDFTAYLKQYADRYPNFHVLGDTLPTYPSKYFGDPWHLNEKGAVKWSGYVAKLLTDSHVEGGPFGAN